MTTVHAYTNDQNLLDLAHKDLRRARAAAVNIVPASTGAARATSLVLESMKGKLDGTALRVPVPDGSITDFTGILGREVTVEEVNEAFRAAAGERPAGQGARLHRGPDRVLGHRRLARRRCTFDSLLTMTMGSLVKVFGWYDNEWGYSNRLVDLARLIGRRRQLSMEAPAPRGPARPVEGRRVLRPGRLQRADRRRAHHRRPAHPGCRCRPSTWLLDHGATRHRVQPPRAGPRASPTPSRHGAGPRRRLAAAGARRVELLENLRFDPGEEANDLAFVERWSTARTSTSTTRSVPPTGPTPRSSGRPARLPSAAGRVLAARGRGPRPACSTAPPGRSWPCSAGPR